MIKFILITVWWLTNGATPVVSQTDFPDSATCAAARAATQTTNPKAYAICVQSQTGLQ